MKDHQIWQIVAKNLFTLFNLVNLILALMIIFVGSYKNLLFIFVAIANTLIGIINELRAYRIVQKMKLKTEQKPTILKDGKTFQIAADEVKKGDILALSLGDQILFDSEIVEGKIEVNESFITGEQDNIAKNPGDEIISGSFIVSGTAKAKIQKIGDENSLNKIEQAATKLKSADAKLFRIMNQIVKYISYALIPIGLLLFWSRFHHETDLASAVTSTVAALISMIPEGLILLTSSVLTLSTIRLSKKQVLIQDLYAIETLARVDTICLDKTGTLTTGKMTVKSLIPTKNAPQNALEDVLKAILIHSSSNNATSAALKKKLLKKGEKCEMAGFLEEIPFSSDRKYSGIRLENGEILMGALEFMTENSAFLAAEKNLKTTDRIISVLEKSGQTETLLGFAILEDELRPNAPEIIKYFYDNDIDVKIISGDNAATVAKIAATVGVKNPAAVDLSEMNGKINYEKIIQEFNIFARVTPAQKKSIILALKNSGKTVAMTGDGVNDILAMKEADCSISIGEGTDAARRASKIVLIGSDFSAVPDIINEGRQTINNLERSTTLFLTKTVYASILSVAFIFLPTPYPFIPIEMSVLNFLCIGLPGFLLAIRPNADRVKNLFVHNIKTYSVPTGLIIAVSAIVLSCLAQPLSLTSPNLYLCSAILVIMISSILIFKISRPANMKKCYNKKS